MKIILASKSNIRINLLRNAGVEFTSIGSSYDESIVQAEYMKVEQNLESIKTLVYKLAHEKAQSISKDHEGLVIGSTKSYFLTKKSS
jgi:predicted house-cleaning NTP pyrophosphatase (Maf/HAM1 superfamily)